MRLRMMSQSRNTAKKMEIFLCVVEKLCIEYSYINCISPLYSYCGAILNISIFKWFMSSLFMIVFLFFWRIMNDNMLSMTYKFFFLLSYIPTNAIYWMKNADSIAFFEINIYWLIFAIAVYVIDKHNVVGLNTFVPSKNNPVLILAFIEIVAVSLYCSWKYGSFRFFISFSDVYSYRLDNATQIRGVLAYIFSWNVTIILPVCLMIFLIQKCYIKSAILIAIQFMCYAIGGNKVYLLYLLFAIGIVILFYLKCNANVMIAVECVFSVALILGTLLSQKIRMFIALVYRLLIIPAESHYYYYDFFQDNPFLLLRQSVLKWIPSPYDTEISVLIGCSPKYFFVQQGQYNNANNGLFSDAYQNFGEIGVLIYPFLIAITLHLIFHSLKKYDKRIQILLMFCFGMYLYSAYFFSWILTGGALIAIIFLIIMKKMTNYV